MNRKIWWILGAAILISALVYAEIQHLGQRCQEVVVNLDPEAEFQFFDEKEIKRLLTAQGAEHLEGTLFKEIDMKNLENRVMRNRLIKKCQVYKDLSGNLVTNVWQHRPIARIINLSENEELTNVQGSYLTDTGAVVPLSGKFTVRILLISGTFFRNLGNLRSDKGKNLLKLLNRIDKDTFWKSQITEMNVEADGEITIVPQVGDYQIEFGLPEDEESKFKKLKIFYKTILANKGWERYKRVSVKFRNQIVCE